MTHASVELYVRAMDGSAVSIGLGGGDRSEVHIG